MSKKDCRLTKSDKTCIRLHVHLVIDREKDFWKYIQEYGYSCYENGQRTRKKKANKGKG